MKSWKMLVAALMACVLTLSLIGCGEKPAEPTTPTTPTETTTTTPEKEYPTVAWKLGHTVADVASLHVKALEAADEIAAATDGKMTIECFANSALGTNPEMVQGLQFGTLDMVIPNAGSLGGYSVHDKAFELPYLVNDYTTNFDDAKAIFMNDDIIDPVNADLEQYGMYWAASWIQGIRHLTTTKTPVHSPADMKGLKIRTMESEAHMAHFNALGANAVPMAFSEVFTALQQGAIDGQENPYYNIYTQGMHEVQGYIIETGHIFDITPVMMASASLEALPEEWQSMVKDAFYNRTVEEWEHSYAQNDDYKQQIIDGKYCEIIELSVDERLAFKNAAESVYTQFADVIGQDYLDLIASVQ